MPIVVLNSFVASHILFLLGGITKGFNKYSVINLNNRKMFLVCESLTGIILKLTLVPGTPKLKD